MCASVPLWAIMAFYMNWLDRQSHAINRVRRRALQTHLSSRNKKKSSIQNAILDR